MEQVEKIQGIAPWMLWVALFVGVALCVVIASVWKVVEINRGEKKRKREEIEGIAQAAVTQQVNTLADDISEKVMASMQEKFDAIDKKLGSDKIRIEQAEKRSSEHDKALERIEATLESVDANIKDIHEGFTFLARGTIATLNHEIHNGNKEELEEAAKELDKYLTRRPIVPIPEKSKT